MWSGGIWDKTGFECLSVGSSVYPVRYLQGVDTCLDMQHLPVQVRKMVVIGGNIWCGTANTIKILNPATKEVEDVVTVGQEESKVSP